MEQKITLNFGKTIPGNELEKILIDSARFTKLNIRVDDRFSDENEPNPAYNFTKFELFTIENDSYLSLARATFKIDDSYKHVNFECDGQKKNLDEYLAEFSRRIKKYI